MMEKKTDYSEQDLKYAAEFREEIHKEALAKLRETVSDAQTVIDRYPVEAYFQQNWEYPGRWYTIVAIPEEFHSREELINDIVRDSIERYQEGEAGVSSGGRESDDMEVVVSSEVRGSDDLEVIAEDPFSAEGRRECDDLEVIAGDPFFELLEDYPGCVVKYCLVSCSRDEYQGGETHWLALGKAAEELMAGEEEDEDDEGFRYDVSRAKGQKAAEAAFFSAEEKAGSLSYQKAFRCPPNGASYSQEAFEKINRSLFPKGTDGLEIYTWTTDWSEYFDEGREWWGALCASIYDKNLGRFVIIMASATD